MGFTVKTTSEADAQAASMIAWLRDNADPSRFIAELDGAIRGLGRSPWLGPPSTLAPGFRRLLLRRSQVHVYYAVDVDRREVTIHALWHTTRGAPPAL